MTCDEFRAVGDKPGSFFEATVALMAAMQKHFDECAECREYLRAAASGTIGKMDPESKKALTESMEAAKMAACQDPEFMDTVLSSEVCQAGSRCGFGDKWTEACFEKSIHHITAPGHEKHPIKLCDKHFQEVYDAGLVSEPYIGKEEFKRRSMRETK